MPTYHNTTNDDLYVDGILFHRGETRELNRYLDSSDLTLVSEEPFYNPVLEEYLITGTDETVEQEVTLGASFIRFTPISGIIDVFLNNILNTPGIRVEESMTLENRNKIIRIHVTFVGNGELLVHDLL